MPRYGIDERFDLESALLKPASVHVHCREHPLNLQITNNQTYKKKADDKTLSLISTYIIIQQPGKKGYYNAFIRR